MEHLRDSFEAFATEHQCKIDRDPQTTDDDGELIYRNAFTQMAWMAYVAGNQSPGVAMEK